MSSHFIESSRTRIDAPSDRADVDPHTWRILASWILIAAALLRLYQLDLKPLHHDEGVNGFFLTKLIQAPDSYRYDPSNYHGPTLYYFALASVDVLGLNTFAIRFVPAFFGIATVWLAFGLRSSIGPIGAIAAATLIALSPGAVYLSRYFIHETLLVCFTLAFVLALVRWLDRGRVSSLALAGIAAGLMTATKETAVLSFVVTGLAAGSTVVWMGTWKLAGARMRAMVAPGAGRAVLSIAGALALFVAVNVLFFSSLFKHWEAVPDAVKSLAFWAHTGTSAHLHPWTSYVSWLVQEEGLLFALGLLGVGFALWRRDNGFAVFVSFWALGILATYSLVPYKTPWLTLNLIVPLAIAGGYGVARAFEMTWEHRRAFVSIAAAILAFVSWQSVSLNFFHYDDPRYPYVYGHTQRGFLQLVQDVDRFAALAAGRQHITVTSPQNFPLSWYLRAYNMAFYDHVVMTDDPIVIGSERQEAELEAVLGASHRRVNAYPLRPGQRLVLYVRRDLPGS